MFPLWECFWVGVHSHEGRGTRGCRRPRGEFQEMQENIPAWLKSPPTGNFPKPPIDTHAQTLPYGDLSWENFERLILRVVRREAIVAECWIYGERGQIQHGIDILASRCETPDEFTCYQCKRVDKFSASDIKKAVNAFLKGKWAAKTKSFILCTSLPLNHTTQVEEIADQRKRLAAQNIGFQVWDGSEGGQLSERLKLHPDLVDDFFLREWVRRFNGLGAADSLGERLDGAQLAELRSQLREIYATLFHRHDQGIRLGSCYSVSLLDRYVAPEVIETREIIAADGAQKGSAPESDEQPYSAGRGHQPPPTSIRSSAIQRIRTPIGAWLSRHGKSVILGEPGYGKSALLRVAALQLLDECDDPYSFPWHGLLPVWISFGGYSAAVQRQPGLSVEDFFDQWLHQNGADSTRPLFRRAVRNGEILLLVDGLDEGQELNAAQQAMDRISAFLAIRPIPAVFTSRPRGYQRVRPDGAWPLARLALFDEEQIAKFSRMWFEHLETPEVAVDMKGAKLRAGRRTDDFLMAIRANLRVMELARTPLFCQLLIDIFRYSHHLPEQRIKVYERIVELLLSDHPAARVQAAGLLTPLDIPQVRDMPEMLMRLALHIQKKSGAGVISIADCQAVLCSFLTDDINGPGFSSYEARHQAKTITEYAQSGLGLLVESAPNELGFFHLTILEYLAAQAMVRKDEQEQLTWLARVWNQPRWHEVILAWFSIRGAEQGKRTTQRAIEHLKQSATGHWEHLQLLRLRTELAAGEMGLSSKEARITIEEAADQVETTPYPELRQGLARQITLGLRSPSVSRQCESRISNWIPGRSDWDREILIEAFGRWPARQDLLHTLKCALHDESVRCRRAAAESIARVFASETEVGEHLETLAANWPDTGVRSAALHGLWKGWPTHGALDSLADAARYSTDVDLALTGIAIRVSKRTLDGDDRRFIWSAFVNGSVPFELRDACLDVLVKGWGKDEEIKRLAMEALQNTFRLFPLETEQVMSFLVKSWPGDSEVALSIANWLGADAAIRIHNADSWKTLVAGFRSDNTLSKVIRQFLSERQSKYKAIFWAPESKWGYCLIGDNAAKAEVLDAYSAADAGREKYWVVSTLMEAWRNDNDVREFLSVEYQKPPGQVAFLAQWIESFVPDPKERRAWLLEALSHADRRMARDPAYRLLEEFQDDECLQAVKATLKTEIWYYDKTSIQNRLFETFPQDTDVRGWAEMAFDEIDGPSLASIATGYSQDSAIRVGLLAAARPAKADVRAEVFRVLCEHAIPAQNGLRLTEAIWAEVNGSIRTAGILVRCIISTQLPEIRENLVKKLREEVNSLGTHYEKRRRSAFVGLLQLGEYEECIEALGPKSNSALHWLANYHEADGLVARTFFEHWDQLHKVSQTLERPFEVPWGGFVYNGTAREALVNDIARGQLASHLKTIPIQDRTPQSLLLMAELLPGSAELRACLIDIMKKPDWTFPQNDSALEAQRIYAEQFGGDVQALEALEESWKPADPVAGTSLGHSPFLYALALGWPDHPAIRSTLQQEKKAQLAIPVVFALCGISGNEDQALTCIDRMIQVRMERGWPLSVPYTQGLRKWASSPSGEDMLRHLAKDSDPSRAITALNLLSIVGYLNDNDRMEMIRDFDEASGDRETPCMDGIDLVDGTVITLPQAIFRALFSDSP